LWQSAPREPQKHNEANQRATRKSQEVRTEVRTGSGVQPEPPWNVILHNSLHPMSWVVYALKKTIPGMTLGKATRLMWTAHTTGQAVVKSTHKELAELYEEHLRANRLARTDRRACPPWW